MRRGILRIRPLVNREGGHTAVEYAVILGVVFVVCLAAIRSLSTYFRASITNSASAIIHSDEP
jgi:Flp pilus assembly pilin Flp